MIKNNNILLTGVTGFIGFNLAKTLSVDNKLYCIIRPTSDITKLEKLANINFIIYDGSIDSLLSGLKDLTINICYHIASLFIAEHTATNVNDLILSNILFPTQLLEVLSIMNVKRVINTGTSWQYFSDHQYNPVCLYAATKQSFDDILCYYNQVKEIAYTTLYLYDTYGPNDDRAKLFNLLKRLKESKQPLDMSYGEQLVNLVYIDDVIKAFINAGSILLNSNENISTRYGIYGDEYSLKNIVQLYELMNKCRLNINWGKRPYRSREVMQPFYPYTTVPGWIYETKLADGIQKLKSFENAKE